MKLTAKITSIIALILTMTMVLTGCSMLEEILNQILGTEEPPVVVEPSGYTISAEKEDGTLYFSGSVSDGRFNGSYRDKFATLVNLTKVSGGFIIHFVDESETIQYIVMDDSTAGGALTTDKFEATIFEWNEDVQTYVVADDNNNRAFGVSKDSTYTTFSCYDVSNTTYNYAKFTPVNDPVIENGEGGKPTGGNNGGNQGGNGGSTGEFGVIETPVVGTAYKFGMVQGNLDNVIYYLKGGMDGYYMATTTSVNEAIDVYIEETTGGYYLYTTATGEKTYINFVVSGEHVNGAYETTASTVYRYDTTSKTLIAEVDGADYWLATRNDKTYTTMGPCKTSYEGFYGQFYGEGGTTGGNQGGNTGNEGGNSGNQGGSTTGFGIIDTPVAGTAYKFGMVQTAAGGTYYLAGGMDGYYMATTTEADSAIDVYLEEVSGGYHLYCMVGGAKTYINATKVTGSDGKEHVNGTYDATALTVYTYDSTLKTLVVTIGDATYAFGTRNDKTYTTVGPCDVSKDPFICQFYGVGGTTSGGNNSGNEGGNNGGNQGGNTDNPFAGGFELSLVPAYSSSYGGYYVINNNTPYFTAEEIATAKAGCFEYYAERDSLGRATLAYACVCNNTRPTDSRGDISSVKPTGWVQKTYDIVPGGSLYNRSHLIAWSLTDEDANWENLVTGTENMNQKVMTQFENQLLSYIKASNSNKVLYRVTPVYNGNNLVCTGILLEAYSLDDNGDDIMFCVFIYNVQPGISIDYATGKSELGDEAGKNSGLAGSIVDDGNQGSTVNPIPGDQYIISANNANGPLYFKGSVTGGRFDCSTKKEDAVVVTVSTVDGGFVLSFQMGGATQYIVMDDNSQGGSFTTDASKATVFEWNEAYSTYMVAEDSNSRAFGAGISSTYTNLSPYDISSSTNEGKYNWATFTKVGTSEGGNEGGNQGGTTTPAHTCESVCDECGKCEDATCTEAACADKCQGHETVDPNPNPGTSESITFNLGANGQAAHKDGDNNTADASYTETANGYTLNITSTDKMYIGATDAKGNSCLKLGTTSVAGDISFTVADDVTSVIIYIAKYKANTSKITVNGTSYTLTKNSNDGQYDEIVVDTSVTKTVTLTTVSGGYRAMINTIVFVVGE